MRKNLQLVTLLLIISMLAGIFASCAPSSTSDESSSETQSTSEIITSTETEATVTEETSTQSESNTESATVSETTSSEETSSEAEPSSSSEETTAAQEESTEKETMISGEYAGIIENANELKNGVQAYFTDSSRDYFALENSEMKFTYALDSSKDQLIASLTNKNGNPYITNTMDVFVRMIDGSTFYASGSTSNTTANLYKIGMYYYEARFEEQDFFNSPQTIIGDPYEGWTINTSQTHNTVQNEDGTFTITNPSDPNIVLDNISFASKDFNLLRIKIRSINGTRGTGTLFIQAGGSTAFSQEQSYNFTFSNDGEYDELIIPLYGIPNYKFNVTKIRFDIDGNTGDSFEIAEICPSKLDISPKAPLNLRLCRSFYVYTDKMHHNIQIAATERTKGIAEVGLHTVIDANTVDKIIVKDAAGLHDNLDNIDWATAEYVGFDIINAGIFGYILPVHENAGNIKVTLENGQYIIEQSRVPEKNGIDPSDAGTRNANDFNVSQRIYTDDNHTFDEFIKEAEIERNPIDNYIKVTATDYNASTFKGYDPVRGIYVIEIDSPGTFGVPYYLFQNKHYTTDVVLRSPDDRDIYLMTYGVGGTLECSVVLSKNNILLPIPVEVCKNFSEPTGERNLYNLDDPTYSESFFPISISANGRVKFTFANIYQNWGQYPLKQISSIQFRAPYYHLSTGVTETNCILPWYNTKTERTRPGTLPDFRAMSAPLWPGQPQRNSGGSHTWLEYTDAEGNYNSSENFNNTIDSCGPTYADVTMQNLSDDGRIKITYTHMEMPQTDENRTYYEIKYEFLEDISFTDFKNNFIIYGITDNEPAATADYRQIGYLNENNECIVAKANLEEDTVREYVLGTECPYFSMFNMPADASPDGYTNLACLIYNSEIIIGGQESDANFIIINSCNQIELSLNIDDVTIKAGDEFTINMIIMPWGSHESDYKNGDVNVRAVRENTLLNPVTITSENDEIIESVFVPKVRSTDGETATFTVKDGFNNISIRAYGFKNLTVPTLYELIDGNWEKVELSSCNTPDTSGFYNHYDGYMVHYDGDGTYSYSFVTTMETGMERTFKLDASEVIESLPDSGMAEAPNYLDIYYDPSEINNLITSSGIFKSKFSQYILSEDHSYISLYANNVPESFFLIAPTANEVSGQYIVVKYRVPTTNSKVMTNFEFFMSSSGTDPKPGENFRYNNVKADGEWHYLVIDASTFNIPGFVKNDEGQYYISYIRFDMINNANLSPDNYIDIGFFGMCDTLKEACDLANNTNFEEIDYFTIAGEVSLDPETAEPIVHSYLDPSSGYTESTLNYYSVIDKLNDTVIGSCGNSVSGIAISSSQTIAVEKTAALGGWATVEGGIDRIVWSADGGKTWNTAQATLSNASSDIVKHAQGKLTTLKGSAFTYDDPDSAGVNGSFQSPRITIDLSEFAGQTVDLIIAAVPASDTSTLCLLSCIEKVSVSQ